MMTMEAGRGQSGLVRPAIAAFAGRRVLSEVKHRRQQGARLGDALMAVAIGQHAVVADLHEAFGQDVQSQPADELGRSDGHFLLPGSVSVVLVGERHGFVRLIDGADALIGDSDPMGVAGKIGQNLFRPGEGALGIDDPFFLSGCPHQSFKASGSAERLELAVKRETSIAVKLSQSCAKLAAEYTGQRSDGKKPVRRRTRPRAVRPQPTAGDDAMNMVVIEERLAPRVQYDGEAQLSAKFVAPELEQSGRGRVEEQVVTQSSILLNQWVERVGQREDHVEVRDRQQQIGLLFHPGATVYALARWAMPVAARMRRESLRAALLALIEMSAKLGRATGHHGPKYTPMLRRHLMLGGVSRQGDAQHLGHSAAGPGGRRARLG